MPCMFLSEINASITPVFLDLPVPEMIKEE